MPSLRHENLAQLFRDCPRLAPTSLQRARVSLPAPVRARVTAESFSDLKPPLYHADTVIALDDPNQTPAQVSVVEIQLTCDPAKRLSWPLYVVGTRARLGVPVDLIIVAPDPEVARWCRQPIPLDNLGNVYRPLVLGPEEIPRITDLDEALAFPELAVLSAAAHGHEEDAAVIAFAALAACSTLDKDRATRYADLIMASLNEAAREALEVLMQQHNYQYESEFARKYFDQGREQGTLAERRQMLCKLLDRRFGPLPADVAARIEAAEAGLLARWIDRTLDEPASLQAVFDER